MTERYLEDFEVGQTFGSGRLIVDSNRIKAFAAEFDPQPFHLDDEAARSSIFGELAASGWHTAALTMRLLVEGELKPAGGIVGVGFDELRWPLPVLPGDELQVESEILEVRPSQSRPSQGLIKVKTTTRNQHGQAVQIAVGNLIVPRRPDQARPGPARALTLEFNEHINNRNLSGLAALMTDDHTFIDSAEHAIRGKSNCLDAWREFFASFPLSKRLRTADRTRGQCRRRWSLGLFGCAPGRPGVVGCQDHKWQGRRVEGLRGHTRESALARHRLWRMSFLQPGRSATPAPEVPLRYQYLRHSSVIRTRTPPKHQQ